MSLINELNRRNVFRVGVVYVIVAWLLLQVADVILPTFRTPDWVMQAFTLLLMLGFPLALIFAWAFELTSEGLKKEKDVERSESITHVTGRKLDFVIIAMLVLALGYFAYDKFVLDPDRDEVTTTAVLKSIAVLPFVAMSSGEDDGYFADGLTEEVLNSLAQISDLKVAGRTSSFYYKGKDQDMRVIGAELGVGNILEGSVRRAGNQLRITAQLVKADDGFHLWSASYDRSIDDIFAIQTDIASKVTAALKVTLLGEEATALSQHGTTNVAAQSKYLIASGHIRHGQALWLDATQNNEHLKAARRLLEEAVELDPDFARAWAKLVPAYYLVAGSGIPDGSGEMLTFPEAIALAGPAAERAIELVPDLPEAWVAIGQDRAVNGYAGGEWALLHEAEAAFERALSLDPDNLSALETYAKYSFISGKYAAAAALFDRAVALDPLSTIRQLRAQAMYRAGRINDARREYFEVARLYPDAPYEGGIAEIEFDRGHFHHGLVWLNDFAGSLQPPYAWSSLGDTDRALEGMDFYKSAGGAVTQFAELADYYFLRDYQGLNKSANAATLANRDVQFLLPSLYYLGTWDDAISMVENWQASQAWPRFPENITGTGGAPDRQYSPERLGRWATQAAYYAHALASAGRREDAEPVWRWALELGERLPKETPRRTQEWHHLRLLVFASRGENEAALSELEAMVDAGWRWLMSPGNMDGGVYSIGLGWFEDSPLLDSIRNEPRFIAAVDKVESDNASMLEELNAGLTLEDIIDEDID